MASSFPRILVLALLAFGAATAFAAHSKARSVEPLDAEFQIGATGTIEVSLNPPIRGVLRITVQARASATRSGRSNSASGHSSQNDPQAMTLEVTQWDRSIPYRLLSQGGRHHLFGSRPSPLVAEIDVNDLTPGVLVRVRVHRNLPLPTSSPQPDLEARAYAVVY
jgi:hypothetical protein